MFSGYLYLSCELHFRVVCPRSAELLVIFPDVSVHTHVIDVPSLAYGFLAFECFCWALFMTAFALQEI